MTGIDSLQQRGAPLTRPGQVRTLMMQPKAEPMVAITAIAGVVRWLIGVALILVVIALVVRVLDRR